MLAGVGIGIGIVSIKRAADFSEGLANLNTIARLSKNDLAKLGDELMGLSNQLGVKKVELLAASYQALSGGIPVSELAEFVELSSKLAKIGQGSTDQAAEALIRLRNAFPDKSDEQIADAVFKTVESGIITIADLGANIGKVTATAAAGGVGLNELLAATAALSKSLKPEEAVTALNQAITKLLDPSKELAKVYKKLGIESGQSGIKQLGLVGILDKIAKQGGTTFNDLSPLFESERARKGILALLASDGAAITGILQGISGAAGVTADTFAAWADTNKKLQFEQLIEQLDSLAINLGTQLLPEVSKLVAEFSKMAESKEDINGLVDGFVALAQAIGFVVGGLLQLIAGMKEFTDLSAGKVFDILEGRKVARLGRPPTEEEIKKGMLAASPELTTAGVFGRGIAAGVAAPAALGAAGVALNQASPLLVPLLAEIVKTNWILSNQLPPAPTGGS